MKRTYTRIAMAALVASAWMTQASADEFLVGAEIPLTGNLARVAPACRKGSWSRPRSSTRPTASTPSRSSPSTTNPAPAKAIAAVEKLASQGVVAITGGYGSNNISPASDTANKLGLVYITSGGVDDSLVASGRKNFFRINNTAGYEKAMLGLLQDVGAKSVSIVYSTKDATTGLAKDVEKP